MFIKTICLRRSSILICENYLEVLEGWACAKFDHCVNIFNNIFNNCGEFVDVSPRPESILSVESNQNVESKPKIVESKTEKCGVQNSIFTSRNQLF